MDRSELMRQIRAGEYVVDPHAVAGAMLSRGPLRDILMSSEVLEPREGDRLSPGADEPHARPGLDPA
jgi:hypothetical protein